MILLFFSNLRCQHLHETNSQFSSQVCATLGILDLHFLDTKLLQNTRVFEKTSEHAVSENHVFGMSFKSLFVDIVNQP